MSHRDSDSKRRHSKFDRESSPKRHRRDKERVTTNDGGGVDREQRNISLPNRSSKHESTDGSYKKLDPVDHSELSKQSSQPSRSRSYYQHDERGSTVQVGRSAGQREADGKVYTQSRENNQRVETSHSREQRDEKSLAKMNDKFQRRDSFPERKDDPTPSMRKRPAFREKKIPVDSGEANPAGTGAVKSSHTDHPSERKEDRSSNPNHLDGTGKQIVDDKPPNNREARRDGFSSRARYGGSGGNSNYRGRDKFNGRQDYHPIKTQTEKWKHDLYQEVNKDPVAKNEDDQIAKLEALLAS